MWDKLQISGKGHYSEPDLVKMDKLAAAIIMLSQGMPFIQLGQDFLRTKPRILNEGEEPDDVNIFSHDSYNAPDYTNSVKWGRKREYKGVFDYYKALIQLRKSSPLFRMNTKEAVGAHLQFMDSGDWNFVVWKLEDERECYMVALNPFTEDRYLNLPGGEYEKILDENGRREENSNYQGNVRVPSLSAAVFKRK